MSDASKVEIFDVEAVNAARTRDPLYAARKKIFPRRVDGTYRRLKWAVMAVTLAIYYITPWLRWDRGPHAPDQAVLIDLANRRFYFFFIEIWPQEFYYVAGLLIMAGFGLFLVTSSVGRAWCGYACPQTVWTDLFMAIERRIEGDRNARMKLDAAPWSAGKLGKRVLKHGVWVLVAVATGGAWVFYFADAPTLAVDLFTGRAAPVAWFTIAILTATTYIFGGHMREQVCTYMCPWPRIQAAMMDENSLTVTYNDWRGEPRARGARRAAAAGQVAGDCVDCNACVAVCPMGIDIRHGQQLECITCALCIDACDAVMEKIGKPLGLISYATLADYQANMDLATDGGTAPIDPRKTHDDSGGLSDKVASFHLRKLLRPRALVYLAAWVLVGLGMVFVLMGRDRLQVNVLADRNPQYVVLSDGSIRNGYTVKLLNMVPEPRVFTLSLDGLPGAGMSITGIDDPAAATSYTVEVEPDRLRTLKVYVSQPRDAIAGTSQHFTFAVDEQGGMGESASYRATFDAPAEAVQ
ncbi:MAG: cytochrome c oxidase accessory protein CcoG [Rubellimicrobium sp.]|nr:cytochrome c oxidase accessory protein CcoG [Rubellimicrobium sp.]